MNEPNLCPCCSGHTYETCCKPFHDGRSIPENALQLMRSRFSAFAYNLPDYIIETTHPGSPQYSENKFAWKRGISRFATETQFQKLEILDFKEQVSVSSVVFTAHITQHHQDATFTEKSYFEKFKKRWMYRGGQLTAGHAPNFVTTKQLRLLPLAYYGDPILRRKADPIEEITDDLKTFAEEMIETMEASDGAGLAAPQVHHSIRLFLVREHIEVEPGKYETGEILVFINPKLSEPSKETLKAPEGCLSIPSIRAAVERPKEITVEYTNLEGEIIKQRFTGWTAKIIMHENDHINGVLYIDRLEKKERTKLEPTLKNIQSRLHDGLAL